MSDCKDCGWINSPPMAIPEGFALVKQEPIGFVPVYPTGIIWKFASATREEAMQKMRHSTGKPYQLLRNQGYDVAPLYSVNLPYNVELSGPEAASSPEGPARTKGYASGLGRKEA